MAPTKISFTTYREMLISYERLINVDYHACVGIGEKQLWRERVNKQFNELSKVTCCKERLVYRFECAADKALNIITDNFFIQEALIMWEQVTKQWYMINVYSLDVITPDQHVKFEGRYAISRHTLRNGVIKGQAVSDMWNAEPTRYYKPIVAGQTS